MKRCAGYQLDVAALTSPAASLHIQLFQLQRAGEAITPSRVILDQSLTGEQTSDGRMQLAAASWTIEDAASAGTGHPCAERLLLRIEVAGQSPSEILISDSQTGLQASASDTWSANITRGELHLTGPYGITLALRPHHVFVD